MKKTGLWRWFGIFFVIPFRIFRNRSLLDKSNMNIEIHRLCSSHVEKQKGCKKEYGGWKLRFPRPILLRRKRLNV